MAKMRIMSRSRVLQIMHRRMIGIEQLTTVRDSGEDRALADFSAMCHMIADGKEVKIFNDVDMGGTVVEYDDA